MNSLPQLRTVRDPKPGTAAAESPNAQTPAPKPIIIPGLEQAKLPPEATAILTEAVQAQFLNVEDVAPFLVQVGARASQMTTRERTCDALIQHKYFTQYQRTRLLAGQTFGMTFGSYRIRDRIGGGTVSAVFVAEHMLLKKPVAIKVLTSEKADLTEIRARFLTEARLLAKLDHPNIVQLLDFGILANPKSSEEIWYLVLDLASQGDVEQFVYARGEALPQALACEWVREAAEGLRAAHEAGLVHRDIKPSNLLLGDNHRIKLTDFGLARHMRSTRTPIRCEVGTLGFAAPEQITDPTTVSPATDIYALGVTLFWLLSGRLPYPEDCPARELLKIIQTGTPKRLRSEWKLAPAQLDAFMARMLARNPADRPNAEAVAKAMETFAEASPHPDVSGKIHADESGPSEEVLRRTIDTLELSNTTFKNAAAQNQAALLLGLGTALAARTPITLGKQKRLAAYTQSLARHLSQQPAWNMFAGKVAIEELGQVCAIADLGLLKVSDAVPFDATYRKAYEEEEYRKHPQYGVEMLHTISEAHGEYLSCLRLTRAAVGSHHERWDGTGYPHGLKGESIPRAARLVSLAQAYDTLRDSADHELVVPSLCKQSRSAFDPDVIAVFQNWAWEWDAIYSTIPD